MLSIKQTKKQMVIAPEGAHIARLIQIIDIGTQKIDWQGETKYQPKIRFTFELCNEFSEFDGVQKPLVVGGEYTMSLSDKARLKPIIEGMLGKKLTDNEKADFSSDDFGKMLGKPCMVSILHTHKDDNVYANIASVTPVPRGFEAPSPFNPLVLYDVSEGQNEVFKNLPAFIRDKILASMEFSGKHDGITEDASLNALVDDLEASKTIKYPTENINPKDIPF